LEIYTAAKLGKRLPHLWFNARFYEISVSHGQKP